MHLAVTGNIGAGKTSLTGLLSKELNYTAQFEAVDNNPYLDDFYKDMKKWSFNLQIYFLSSRFNQIKHIRQNKLNVIQDRTIYEDALIFASNLRDIDAMSERDYNNYYSLYNMMAEFVEAPDLLIYLRASVPTLVKQIEQRGRSYENSISIDYLSRLNDKYEKWIKSYSRGKLLIIESDNLDFVNVPKDLEFIKKEVLNKLK